MDIAAASDACIQCRRWKSITSIRDLSSSRQGRNVHPCLLCRESHYGAAFGNRWYQHRDIVEPMYLVSFASPLPIALPRASAACIHHCSFLQQKVSLFVIYLLPWPSPTHPPCCCKCRRFSAFRVRLQFHRGQQVSTVAYMAL